MKIRLHKNKEDLEAENRWWAALTDKQKQAEIDRRNKEDDAEEAARLVIGCLAIVLVVVVPMVLGIVELCKIVFKM